MKNVRNFDLLKITENVNVSEGIIEDMCLQYLKDRVLDEDYLYDKFIEVIKHPSTDINVLRERQAIFKDFVTYGNLARDILNYCEEAEDIRKKTRNSGHIGNSVNDRLKNYVNETIPMLELIERFGRMFNKKFESKTLPELKFGSMKNIIDEIYKLQNITKSNSLTLSVNFLDGLKLKEGLVHSTEKVNIKPNYKKDKVTKEYVLTDTDIAEYTGNFMFGINVEEIQSKALLHLCGIISQISNTILMFFKTLKQDIYFYIAALRVKKHMDDNNLPCCMPEIYDDARGITALDVYSYTLAVFTGNAPVTNSVDFTDGKFVVITGLNQGGKTTFLRSIGVAQLFAQAGIMVPAVKYSGSVYNGIVSHFPKEEDNTLNFGKLAEELERLRKELPLVVNGGLVMLNESFATTTEKEGGEIASDVLRALSKTDSSVIFVTHLYELAVNLDKLNDVLYNDIKAVSYTTEANRGYKILKGEPLRDMQLGGDAVAF
jgi:Mismatch repair ATPase (MutS family)